MPSVVATGSTNIATWDSKIVADLCSGIFYVDVSPSIFIGAGADNVLGAKVKITNPYGVVIKGYSSVYDIAAPLTAIYQFTIPTQAGNFQYGKYIIDVQVTDEDGVTKYVVSKTVNVCEPDPKNKTRKYGTLSATLKGVCKNGKIYVLVDGVPVYKGKVAEQQVNDFTLTYPTSSGLPPLETTIGNFSDLLFEGVYKIAGEVCATYNFGDNVYIKVKYKVKKEKDIRCLLDECCVFAKLSELNLKIKSDCTQAEKEESVNITIDALRLLKTAQLAGECGEDASEYITDLEALLGCSCTCNCAEGTPIIGIPAVGNDIVIEGCNVQSDVTGLTTTYTINNYEYIIEVEPNGDVLTVSVPSLTDCTKTQVLTFSIAALYPQIKTLLTNDTSAFWSVFINNILNAGDVAIFEELAEQIAACCECAATATLLTTENVGADVNITWESEGAESVDIYLDNIFVANLLAAATSYSLIGASDGNPHTLVLIPRCSNGRAGDVASSSFTYIGCPEILPPSVSSNSVNAECPYDLTALVAALPVGITAEWHTANNTLAATLVGNPEAVSNGIYFVFAKNGDGCYSIGIQVTVICTEASACTAPQTLLVTTISGGNLVQFQSAAFPPPLNSYTVKRRLSANPDIDGSYTTIGTPAWNATSNRWEILDATAVNNQLYTYKAISNCGGTSPSTTYQYANFSCQVVTLTPGETTIGYSFTGAGGAIDKYEVRLYEGPFGGGGSLVHTDTHVPAFPTPITGEFTYLESDQVYRVLLVAYIGTYSNYLRCPPVSTTTLEESNVTISNESEGYTVDHTSPDISHSASYPVVGALVTEQHGGFTGTIPITIGGNGDPSTLTLSVNGVEQECIDVTAAGAYVFASGSYLIGDLLEILLTPGTCS